jgi:UDP-glucose 4-epimerase
MKNTVVTGGAGFIGSHLTEQLLNHGHRVLVLDNCSTGREENLAHLLKDDKLSFLHCDATDYQVVRPLFEGMDWVFHLAALADVVPSIQTPISYHQSNVDGTVMVLEASRQARIKRFIYAASSSCYGVPEQYPTPESARIQPMYPYALTKWIGEEYVRHWHKMYRLPCVSLRLFNVYGPRSRTSGSYGAVFGVFLAQKLAGKPFTVVGDGTQTRDFTYVSDVADAFVRAAESDIEGEVLNVGSGNTYSVNRLIELLGGEVVHVLRRPGEPDCTFADVRKIRRVLGWEAKTSFEQGVATMLANIEYWRAAPVWEADSISEATKDWFRYVGRT